MRKQDHLLGLIASLDANERRNFRLFASQQQDDTNYLKLFDALEGKEVYNATELSKTLGISLPQLHKQKNYLAKVLLKSLRFYKTNQKLNSLLSNSIMEIEELIARKLYDYALEVADKALAMADENDYHHLSPVFIQYKLDIFIITGKFDEIKSADDKMKMILAALREQHDIHTLIALVNQFQHSRQEPTEFLYHDHPQLHRQPEDIQNKRSLMAWFAMMNSYQTATRQPQSEILALVRKQVDICESNPNLRDYYYHAVTYSWLTSAEVQAGNYQKAWEATEKLIQIIADSRKVMKKSTAENISQFVDITRVTILFQTGRYEEGMALANSMAPERLQNDYMRFSLAFERAKGLLHTRHSAEAIDTLEELLQIDDNLGKELQPYIRPMLILAQLDIGNHQVVPYLVKSTRSWMKRRKIQDPEIDLFLSHTYAIAKAPMSGRKDQWAKFKAVIAKGSLEKMNKEIHLGRWIEVSAHL